MTDFHRVPEDHVGHYDVPEGCTEMRAWNCNSLTGLTIREGCAKVWVFNCDALTGLTISAGCAQVDVSRCPALTALTISESCTEVLVSRCPALTHINGESLNTPEQAAPYLRAIAKAALQPDALEMDVIHSDCGTAHCMAGWAEVLFPEKVKPGRELFDAIPLLGREAADMFFEDNDTAREFLERYAEATA